MERAGVLSIKNIELKRSENDEYEQQTIEGPVDGTNDLGYL